MFTLEYSRIHHKYGEFPLECLRIYHEYEDFVLDCATALHVVTFFAEMYFFASCFGTDLFMAFSKSLGAKISNVCEFKRKQVIVCMRDQRHAAFAYLREMLPFVLNILLFVIVQFCVRFVSTNSGAFRRI